MNAWEKYKVKKNVTPFDLLNKDNYIEVSESNKECKFVWVANI